jgi:hypothetical protein
MMAFPERLKSIRVILQNCKEALELFLGSFLLAGQVIGLCELFVSLRRAGLDRLMIKIKTAPNGRDKGKKARSLSPPSGKGERHENSSLSFRCSDSRFFDAAGDGFLVIPSFYRKVVTVPGSGTIESYGVIGGDI